MRIAITHPCILWWAEQRTRLPFFTASAPSQPSRLAAVDSGGRTRLELAEFEADGSATARCPVADHCSIVDRCSREMYAAYVDRFGIEEFTAVPAGRNASREASVGVRRITDEADHRIVGLAAAAASANDEPVQQVIVIPNKLV